MREHVADLQDAAAAVHDLQRERQLDGALVEPGEVVAGVVVRAAHAVEREAAAAVAQHGVRHAGGERAQAPQHGSSTVSTAISSPSCTRTSPRARPASS